jgi:protein-disulfide isomerase
MPVSLLRLFYLSFCAPYFVTLTHNVSSKDYIRGNPDAKVVIVEYSDTECPYCKQFQGTMKNLIGKLGKDGAVAWVYRNFPIKELHSKAPKEAEALLCAGKIGGNNVFWDYTDRIYSITPSNNGLEASQLSAVAKDLGIDVTKFNACLSSGEMAPLVKIDYEDGVKAGGAGTPFSVFVASKEFDAKEVEKFLIETIIKYRFPADLFVISKDSRRVAVSGAMPQDFLEQLVAIMSK